MKLFGSLRDPRNILIVLIVVLLLVYSSALLLRLDVTYLILFNGYVSVFVIVILIFIAYEYAAKTSDLVEASRAQIDEMRKRDRIAYIERKLEKLYSPIMNNEEFLVFEARRSYYGIHEIAKFADSLKPNAYLAEKDFHNLLKAFFMAVATRDHYKLEKSIDELLKKCKEDYDRLVDELMALK